MFDPDIIVWGLIWVVLVYLVAALAMEAIRDLLRRRRYKKRELERYMDYRSTRNARVEEDIARSFRPPGWDRDRRDM